MTEPTQEQIKEFWEWCGFRYYDEIVVEDPNGEWMHEPDIDLNNLFKYAVPKLGRDAYAVLYKWIHLVLCEEDFALALLWTIWEVIHKD